MSTGRDIPLILEAEQPGLGPTWSSNIALYKAGVVRVLSPSYLWLLSGEAPAGGLVSL